MRNVDLPAPDVVPARITAWPLPAWRYVPGVGPHPSTVPGHLPEVPEEAWVAYGLDLLAWRFAWEAHEVWERAWHTWPDGPAREGLQGCIQAAATLLLRHLGRPRAMATQAHRARVHLSIARQAGVGVDGIDVAGFWGAWEAALQTGGWPDLEGVWRGP